jgi:hypothetical protein
MEGAARYVGCAPSTIRREALRNPEFNELLRRAHLAAELNPLQAMRQASNKHWRAAAWLLERTNPQRFAKQNVRTIKPEQLHEFQSTLINILKEEAQDPALRRRIVRRMDELSKQMDQDALAAHLDPCPQPRRSRRSQQFFPPMMPPPRACEPNAD